MKIDDFNDFLNIKGEFFPFSFSKNKIIVHPNNVDKLKELCSEWFYKDFNKKITLTFKM